MLKYSSGKFKVLSDKNLYPYAFESFKKWCGDEYLETASKEILSTFGSLTKVMLHPVVIDTLYEILADVYEDKVRMGIFTKNHLVKALLVSPRTQEELFSYYLVYKADEVRNDLRMEYNLILADLVEREFSRTDFDDFSIMYRGDGAIVFRTKNNEDARKVYEILMQIDKAVEEELKSEKPYAKGMLVPLSEESKVELEIDFRKDIESLSNFLFNVNTFMQVAN